MGIVEEENKPAKRVDGAVGIKGHSSTVVGKHALAEKQQWASQKIGCVVGAANRRALGDIRNRLSAFGRNNADAAGPGAGGACANQTARTESLRLNVCASLSS